MNMTGISAVACGTGSEIPMQRLDIRFVSDDRRVINLPFMPGGGTRVRTLFRRIEKLSDEIIDNCLTHTLTSYTDRHRDLMKNFERNFERGYELIDYTVDWSLNRRRLAGAYLTMEYSIESAALFNPSIVEHPDQTNVPPGGKRFIMSLRATGEGHVSSIVFRTGMINPDGSVTMDPPSRLLSRATMAPDRQYLKELFANKLAEMGTPNMDVVHRLLHDMPDKFSLDQLTQHADAMRHDFDDQADAQSTVQTMLWLARSNFHIDMPAHEDLSALAIFPNSSEEARGIEDLRLVRFIDDDATAIYFGTYTAYDGTQTLPMLVETYDFHRIDIHSLNGQAAINKGMALFPRRIGGHYVMSSRIDGENLYIAYSDYVHFWESAEKLRTPKNPWELMQLGNCGSPLETSEGWLLLTHGVGPMRTYSIGAMLLDREDPMKVIGHLDYPLLAPTDDEREGYVPNVVYTCGAMIHQDHLYMPYAVADKATSMVRISLDTLINRLMDSAGNI